MKLMVASDLHGSFYYAKAIIDKFLEEKADKLVLLGDIYYHGPRNPLPKDYNPMEVAKLLNGYKDKLIVIHGNCDAEVDQMISEFTFVDNYEMQMDGKRLFFTHGHKINKDNMQPNAYDVLIYGHFHINMMERVNGVLVLNPGSVSLPKADSKSGYLILDKGLAIQKDILGSVLNSTNI